MKLKITLGEELKKTDYINKQNVNFFYLLNSVYGEDVPEKASYTGENSLIKKYPNQGIALLNYTEEGRVTDPGFGITNIPTGDYLNGVSVYKKEIWYTFSSDGSIIQHEEPNYHIVVENSQAGTIYDYNIANNRYYKYLYRFVYTDEGGEKFGFKEIISPIKVKWQGWSITELHEVEGSNGKEYTSTLSDVWKFKYNISPGEQTQNVSKTQQDTLGRFPRFSQGPKNAISGQVQCLLGRDFLPADYTQEIFEYKKRSDTSESIIAWEWQKEYSNKTKNLGGYKEYVYTDEISTNKYLTATSNAAVDALERWREVCYSGNPKLLKDSKGQKFIVQIYDTSNSIEENWEKQPNQISFSWIQIADANDVVITQEV